MNKQFSTNKSKINTILLISVIILLTTLIGIILFFNLKKDEAENQSSINNISVNEKVINKLDNTRDLVYDAEYTYGDLNGKFYISEISKERYSLDNIIVPYININSADAINANKEIKNLFNKLAESFKSELDGSQIGYNISSYKTYTNNNILSVIITIESGGTAPEVYEYYTYNFDLKTLKRLSYYDVYNNLGCSSSDVDLKVKKGIMNNSLLSQSSEVYNFNGNNRDTYINKSVNNYKESVSNNSINYFIDSNGKLNVIVMIEAPIQGEKFNKIIIVD